MNYTRKGHCWAETDKWKTNTEARLSNWITWEEENENLHRVARCGRDKPKPTGLREEIDKGFDIVCRQKQSSARWRKAARWNEVNNASLNAATKDAAQLVMTEVKLVKYKKEHEF